MQINLESSTLRPRPLMMPFPGRSAETWSSCKRRLPGQPVNELLHAREDALRTCRSEGMAWLGLVLCALAVVLLSFCL